MSSLNLQTEKKIWEKQFIPKNPFSKRTYKKSNVRDKSQPENDKKIISFTS